MISKKKIDQKMPLKIYYFSGKQLINLLQNQYTLNKFSDSF